MKIIGEGKDNVIVDMTREEAARLNGYNSEYSAGQEGAKVQVGLSFSIDKLYENAREILCAYKELKDQFQRSHKTLSTLLGFMKNDKE